MCSLIYAPCSKAVLRVGSKESTSATTKASSGGAVEFPAPVVLQLGPEDTLDTRAQGGDFCSTRPLLAGIS